MGWELDHSFCWNRKGTRLDFKAVLLALIQVLTLYLPLHEHTHTLNISGLSDDAKTPFHYSLPLSTHPFFPLWLALLLLTTSYPRVLVWAQWPIRLADTVPNSVWHHRPEEGKTRTPAFGWKNVQIFMLLFETILSFSLFFLNTYIVNFLVTYKACNK